MRVIEAAARRGISEILHYTTRRGALGVLATGRVLSRQQLDASDYLENVATPVSTVRSDPEWVDYISLSVTRINAHLFGIVSGSWYAGTDVWWVVLSFEVGVLDHPGVVFTTTNNIYPSCRRGVGYAGFEAMFAPTVNGRHGRRIQRTTQADNEPTDRQAEVLYPTELTTESLRNIYVNDVNEARLLRSQRDTLRHPNVPIEIRPEVFV